MLVWEAFFIYSDHQPFMHILSETKSAPAMASACLQRWALTLSAYQYSIKYRKGDLMGNADGLSRLPLPDSPDHVPSPPENITLMEQLANMPMSASQLRTMTNRNPILAKVKQFTLHRWPSTLPSNLSDLQPHWKRRDKLSLEDGNLLWGSRVVVPPQAQKCVIEEAHAAHIGISRMKSLARQFVWWPKMDLELEAKVKSCKTCQLSQNEPPQSTLHPWEWPQQPWIRVHADYAGPMFGKMFLI